MFTTSFKLIQPCPLLANHVLLCYYCSLLSPFLVCMLECYQLLPPVTPWIGLSHYLYCCGLYDYYNVDYIQRRMEGLGYPAPTLCSIRVTYDPSSGYWFQD